MRIALAQLVAGADPAANLDLVAEAARDAADQRADLLICPEATMRCFGLPLGEIAEPADGPWVTASNALPKLIPRPSRRFSS